MLACVEPFVPRPLLTVGQRAYWNRPIRRDPQVSEKAYQDFQKLIDALLHGIGRQTRKKSSLLVDVEDKYIVTDAGLFNRSALAKGFRANKPLRMEETYLDLGHHFRSRGQAVRIRRVYNDEGAFVEGELKWEGTRGQLQDRPFYELRSSSREEFEGLVRMLNQHTGVVPHTRLVKLRTIYSKTEGSGQETLIEFDHFPRGENPPLIEGRTYSQIAQEVPEGQRSSALRFVEALAREFGLVRENRDYTEIAWGLARL